jgi:mannose-6-phosphate isomerase-like protein (cupin superfamily)
LESRERYQRLISKDSGSFGIKSGHVILKPGENIGGHTTGEREEMIIILKGNGELTVDEDTILKIDKDSILYIEPETRHDIKNTGSTILEYIFVTSLAKI